MAFKTTIQMSIPNDEGNAICVETSDLTTATEIAITAFSQGFMCQRYNETQATHIWVGNRWETREETMAVIAKTRAH